MKKEEQLLRSLSCSSADAFDTIYMMYASKVELFAASLLKDGALAKDITHDIFMTLWKRRSSAMQIESLGAYFYSSVRNAVFNMFEHRKVCEKYEHSLKVAEDFFSEDVLSKISAEDLAMLIELELEQMPQNRAQIFRLSRYEGKTYKEIAELMGLSVKTVEYHISMALAQLRQAMA